MGRPGSSGPWIGVDSQRAPLGAKFPGTHEASSRFYHRHPHFTYEQTEVQGGLQHPSGLSLGKSGTSLSVPWPGREEDWVRRS